MGRFAQKYSQEQKRAAAEAVVDGEKLYGRRLYPRDVVAMAAAGELADLPPFEIGKPSVQKMATDLRKRRTGQAIQLKRERGTVEERLEALTAQRLRILEFEQDRIERKAKAKGLTAEDLELVKRCGLAEREIRARSQAPSSGTGQGARRKQPSKEENAKGKSDLVRNLERELRQQGQKGEQQDGEAERPADMGEEERGQVPAIA